MKQYKIKPTKLEIQTSGVMLTDNYIEKLSNYKLITGIALSLANPFDLYENFYIMKTPKAKQFNIITLINNIRKYFKIRISIVYTKFLEKYTPEDFILFMNENKINEVTFRFLYGNSPWIEENRGDFNYFKETLEKEIVKYKTSTCYAFGGDCHNEQNSYNIIDLSGTIYKKWEDIKEHYKSIYDW